MRVVYKITNLINGKIYVGSTGNFEIRKSEHFGLLRNGKHDNWFLQRDYDIYGNPAFVMEIMEDGFQTYESMIIREYQLIDKTRAFNYNIDTECPVLSAKSSRNRKKVSLGGGIIYVRGGGARNRYLKSKSKVRKNQKIKTDYPVLDAIAQRKREREAGKWARS